MLLGRLCGEQSPAPSVQQPCLQEKRSRFCHSSCEAAISHYHCLEEPPAERAQAAL